MAARAGAVVASLCLGFGSPDADATPIDPLTEVHPGPEGLVTDALAAQVPGLTRLADDSDEVWALPATVATIEVRPVIRHAGYDNQFGLAVLGESGPGPFNALFTAPGPSDWKSVDGSWLDLGEILTPGEAFVFGIRTPHYTVLSQVDANIDSLDHMVTWFDADTEGRFFLGFEDTLGGGGRDFNDLVVELRYVELLPQPATVAEPPSAALFGLGLAVVVLVPTVRRLRFGFIGK